MTLSSDRAALLVGLLRAGVGVGLLAAPALAVGEDGRAQVLLRTVGLRDVVLGLGAVVTRGPARTAWVGAGLASDLGDVVIASRSRAELGTLAAAGSALAPLPMIAAAVVAVRRRSAVSVARSTTAAR